MLATTLSVVTSIPLYQRLVEDQNPPEAVSDLEFGRHGYLLQLPGGSCIGWTRYELTYDGAYSFLTDTSLRYSLEEEETVVQVAAGAAFNSLNQLSGSYVKVTVKGNEYRLKTEGVTDIRVTLRGEIEGRPLRLAYALQGPVEIYESSEGSFLIRSEHFPALDQIATKVQAATPFQPANLFETTKVDFYEKDELSTACQNSGETALQLDGVYKLVKQFSGTFLKGL